jgi:hypothetical protein
MIGSAGVAMAAAARNGQPVSAVMPPDIELMAKIFFVVVLLIAIVAICLKDDFNKAPMKVIKRKRLPVVRIFIGHYQAARHYAGIWLALKIAFLFTRGAIKTQKKDRKP